MKMDAFEREAELAYRGQSLPTPSDTPYRTPSLSMSRRSSRHGNGSPIASSSPPPQLGPDPTDAANDENISILDPRRFTPTLHASLVSEILSLRRDLDTKAKAIEDLETSLHGSRVDYETLNDSMSKNGKETRSLRRQLQLLEGGTSSALGELARERDEAVDSVTDIKRRYEISQKKVKSQEDDVNRFQKLWENDKENWETERRNMERKVHAVEGRMKTVLDEVAAYQASIQAQHPRSHGQGESETDDGAKDGRFGHDSETESIRSISSLKKRPQSSMSFDDHRGPRMSILNSVHGYGNGKHAGLSLADELSFDNEEEENIEDSIDDRNSKTRGHGKNRSSVTFAKITGRPHTRNASIPESIKSRPGSSHGHRFHSSEPKVEYVDSGVQPTPPPSPKMLALIEGPPAALPTEASSAHDVSMEPRAASGNVSDGQQDRKMVSEKDLPVMVSASSQTVEHPLSPPRTPQSPRHDVPLQASLPPADVEMRTAETQTEAAEIATPVPRRGPTPRPIPIPSIAIHAPTSAPTTPGESLLPSHTKDAACQASMVSTVKQRSIASQTEEIRVYDRAIKLPPHLLPSAISSAPPTPEPDESPQLSPAQKRKVSRRSLRQRPLPGSIQVSPPGLDNEDAYPGRSGTAPPASDKASKIKRPFRGSSLFTGFDRFDLPSTDEGDEFDDDISDSDFRTPLSAPKQRPRRSKRFSNPPKAVPEDVEHESKADTHRVAAASHRPSHSSKGHINGDFSTHKASEKTGSATVHKPPNIRKSALISSGAAAHTQRARSPSLGDLSAELLAMSGAKQPIPPFPVPTRSSSRNIPFSSSDGTQTPSNGSASILSAYRRSGRPSARSGSLRKVRSAAALPRTGPVDRGNRNGSPPPLSTSSVIPDSPLLPPMPTDEVRNPRAVHGRNREGHIPQASINTSHTGEASISSSTNQTSVVDAIAQTMVGEWMWKYVRRRKSFGVPETPQPNWEMGKSGEEISASITGSGIRHKRWVWLAPYERAVMWSSRQPTSGSALLGKSGRKRKDFCEEERALLIPSLVPIQSVLDVKDDTPTPKGIESALFNRSILILTPARALKFTAPSKERHYVWLTALSFLSNSTLGMNDIAHLPPLPPPSQEVEATRSQSNTTLRRNPIRDSIRIAKGKSRPVPAGASIQPPAPAIQEVGYPKTSDDPIGAAAEPPTVPRFSTHSNHTRKRSNTGPRQRSSAFKAFSQYPMPSANASVGTFASSDVQVNGHALHSGQSSVSMRTSEASGPLGAVSSNFFDAVGTMRMEAFVHSSPLFEYHERDEYVGPSSSKSRATKRRSGRDMPWSGRSLVGNGSMEFARGDDPFGGF